MGFVGLGILGLVCLALLGLLIHRLVERGMSGSAGAAAPSYREIEPGEPAVEMVVEGQNRKIGTRNVRVIPKGGSRSVGGGRSAFVIFAYPTKPGIAELVRRGDDYAFKPVKTEYCESDHTVESCLNQPITVLSSVGRKVTVWFQRYVSPLERINRIMHLTDKPGRE